MDENRLKPTHQRIPPGLWIAMVAVALVGGRWLWVISDRPPHGPELISEFSSVGYLILRGGAQPDRAGTRVAYAQTTEKGAGIFILDTVQGKKELVHEDMDFDVPQLLFGAWAWSPDDALLAYVRSVSSEVLPRDQRTGMNDRLVIWQASTGRDLAEFEMEWGKQLTKLVWLAPDTLAWDGADDQIHLIQKDSDGHWRQSEPTKVKVGNSSLTALSSNTIAWNDTRNIWALNLASNAPTRLFKLPTNRLVSFCYSRESRQFLLQVSGKDGDSLWRLSPDYSSPENLARLKSDSAITGAQWINGNSGGYAYLTRKPDHTTFTVHSTPDSEPARLFTHGNANSFTTAADGKQLFIEGVESNELAEGLWQYDVAAQSLRNLVACSTTPVRYAEPAIPVHEFVTLPSGQKFELYLYRPANFDRREHKKYPLIIGYTPFVATVSHMAQVCAPVLANCGAYVVIIRRPGWEIRLKEWGDDVMACYNYLAQDPAIDQQRVFLFSRSRESSCLYELMAKHPEPWKGVIVLNGGLPPVSELPSGTPMPRILFDGDDNPWAEKRLAPLQAQALQQGVMMDGFLHKDAPHDFIAQDTLRDRMRNMVHFVFDQ